MHLIAVLVLAKSFSHRLGYELGQRYGLVTALGIILVVFGVPYLILRAMGGRTEQEERDARAIQQEESDRRRASADGPPRFNG